ncbi:MAG: protein-export chaperone SecB [Gammaproteobacteria bacterium RIFCSPHIGHO2_12_FULL_40_19]|nr:MAG: protein-export chaperone SecB [Gammaproteobacteria bacterium RIFCSPHIGHO2_12_FULL_40_19]
MTSIPQNQNDNTSNQPSFAIQRIYIKDLSFEAPQSPDVFQKQWQPEVNLQLQTQTNTLDNDAHEVVLSLHITATSEEKTIFLIEVKQAGIFTIKNLLPDQLKATLGSVCPNILFPYARELISDLVTRGTFPQLYLAPINFDALYAQHLEQEKTKT